MSIKAYEAYRFTGKLSEFIPTMLSWRKRFEKRLTYCHKKMFSNEASWEQYYSLVRDKVTNPERSPLDYEVGFRIFQAKNTIILIPRYERSNLPVRRSIEFLKTEPLLTEFGYWDNTDRPDHISKEEWKKRAKLYDLINDPIYISFMSYETMYMTDPTFGTNVEIVEGF